MNSGIRATPSCKECNSAIAWHVTGAMFSQLHAWTTMFLGVMLRNVFLDAIPVLGVTAPLASPLTVVLLKYTVE